MILSHRDRTNGKKPANNANVYSETDGNIKTKEHFETITVTTTTKAKATTTTFFSFLVISDNGSLSQNISMVFPITSGTNLAF